MEKRRSSDRGASHEAFVIPVRVYLNKLRKGWPVYNIVWATLAIRENRFSGRNVSFSSAKQDEWWPVEGLWLLNCREVLSRKFWYWNFWDNDFLHLFPSLLYRARRIGTMIKRHRFYGYLIVARLYLDNFDIGILIFEIGKGFSEIWVMKRLGHLKKSVSFSSLSIEANGDRLRVADYSIVARLLHRKNFDLEF